MKSSVTVVEKIVAEVPASLEILDAPAISQIPGLNLDDRLRSVPGFSLFRRSSSQVAHPTTQGISLRGIGSSGASRTLVLWDGFPVNDPFGGWVYWTRFDPEELQRIEISRGASTSVFGDRALGGAIGLFTREPEPWRLHGAYEFGNRNTHNVSVGGSQLWRRFAASMDARAYTTNGYFIVPENRRGSVDREAAVRFVGGDTRLDYLGTKDRMFVKLDILAEERANGSPLQINSTSLGTIGANYHREQGSEGISVLGWHTREEFRSGFSAIAADRNSERLTYNQSVPAKAVGASGIWRRTRNGWSSLIGADVLRVEGTSTDSLFPTGKRIGGGTQRQNGVFLQGDAKAGPLRFFVGAREQFSDSFGTFFSPSAGVTAGKGIVRWRGSVYRAFRAPTLNELYREFRVGNTITQANSLLRPETMFGAETGFDLTTAATRASVTFYRNSLDDLITNVTLLSSPAQIIRQRRNAAAALARGMEVDLRQRWRNWRGEASYLFADSRFATGERIPQVPRHQGSLQVVYQREKSFVAAGVRSSAAQFEDERNQFLLPGYAVAHISFRQTVARGLSAYAGFENLLNREYLVGFSPTPLIGAPRLWRIGLRWDGRLRRP